MRVLGLMVAHNEADRYLECALTHLVGKKVDNDNRVVVDDQSTDDTGRIARAFTPNVVTRPDDVPSFLEHEARFRSYAWRIMEELTQPEDGDWVLLIDADEITVGTQDQWRQLKSAAATGTGGEPYNGIRLPIPEAWQLDPLETRVDGFWGHLNGIRLVPWRPNAQFNDRPMGCGSNPTYSTNVPLLSVEGGSVRILHLGYAHPDDRAAKFARYNGRPGHNPTHIGSIVMRPTLRPWNGEPIDVWRGQQ